MNLAFTNDTPTAPTHPGVRVAVGAVVGLAMRVALLAVVPGGNAAENSAAPGKPSAILSLLLAGLLTSQATEVVGNLKPETLTIAFSQASFVGVNRNDVEAGYRVLAETVGRRRGYLVDSKTKVYGGLSEYEAILRDEAVRMVIVNSWRYLDAETKRIAPCFVASERGQVGKRYLLLTRTDSGLNTLAHLRGKNLVLFEAANTTLGRTWLETLLRGQGLEASDTHFGSVASVSKPSLAVLPVFFGSKHACVVDQPGFEVMKELNPQVGRALQSVAASDALVDSLICLRTGDWSAGSFKEDVIRALGELHHEPAGAQILTLFRTEQLVPFKPDYLETMQTLRAAHQPAHQACMPGSRTADASLSAPQDEPRP